MASLLDFLTGGNGGGLLGNLQPGAASPQPQQGAPDQGGGLARGWARGLAIFCRAIR